MLPPFSKVKKKKHYHRTVLHILSGSFFKSSLVIYSQNKQIILFYGKDAIKMFALILVIHWNNKLFVLQISCNKCGTLKYYSFI